MGMSLPERFVEIDSLIRAKKYDFALEDLNSIKQDPSNVTDSAKYNRILNFTRLCHLGMEDHNSLAEDLEECLVFEEGVKSETILLTSIRNLFKAYLLSNQFEKATFLSKNYQQLLSRQNFSETFEKNMIFLYSTTLILTGKISEAETLLKELSGFEFDYQTLGEVMNNLGFVQMNLPTKFSTEEIVKSFKESILLHELDKFDPLIAQSTGSTQKALREFRQTSSELALYTSPLAKKEEVPSELADPRKLGSDLSVEEKLKLIESDRKINFAIRQKLQRTLAAKEFVISDIFKVKSRFSIQPLLNIAQQLLKEKKFGVAHPWIVQAQSAINSLRVYEALPLHHLNSYLLYKKTNITVKAEQQLRSMISSGDRFNSEYAKVGFLMFAQDLENSGRFFELGELWKDVDTKPEYESSSEIDEKKLILPQLNTPRFTFREGL